jgi:hypothetical protein
MSLRCNDGFLDKINKIYNSGIKVEKQILLCQKYTGENSHPAWGGHKIYKIEGNYGSGLASAGRALIQWLIDSKKDCNIIIDEERKSDSAEARPREYNLAKDAKPCNVDILAHPQVSVIVLAHEMIHAHHFMHVPWNEDDRIADFHYKIDSNPCGKEEARTVGLGTYDKKWFSANPKIITENMICLALGKDKRIEY